MSRVHVTSNTEKVYPCVQCGSQSANIIREGKSLEETRVKCNNCQLMYNASDSIAAKEADAIPDKMPELKSPRLVKENPREPKKEKMSDYADRALDPRSQDPTRVPDYVAGLLVPRTPSYVFILKDRSLVQFCTKKDLKKTVLKWEQGKNYDCYELTPKKAEAKVEIS